MTTVPKPENESHWSLGLLTAGRRTCHHEKRFALWMLAWALVLGLCMYLLRQALVAPPYSWLVALLPSAFALVPLHAYYTFIMQADELIRKIQMEAIAVGFLVGVLYAMGRQLLEAAGLEPASAADTGVMMLFAFGLAQLYGAWKYR